MWCGEELRGPVGNLLVAGWLETVVSTKAYARKGKAKELHFMS